MGKNIRHESNIPLHNGNSGCVNKFLHALNRRQRWQNVRKVLPNKRQGSGKHIIDGGSSEPTTNTCQPQEVHPDPKKNNPKANIEASSASKSSKKFRIRSLISDEMAKRRGKHHVRRSSSPSSSPKKKTIKSVNQNKCEPKSGMNEKPPTENNCDSPSTTKKKRKCDICAAMLTVSYLRQKGLANEHRIGENIDEKKQHAYLDMLQVSDGHDTHYVHSHTPSHSRIGLTKSFSFPIPGSTKRIDYELEELKNKLRDCKDIQTTKEKFILPMNQWKDFRFPKPMLTRPESFKTPSSTSQKEKKQTTNKSKSLKQKIGYVIKDNRKEDNRKEKRRILMDAVFHKIPYGRRSSKDPRKVGPYKLKSSSTSSSGSHQSSIEKSCLKKTASTGEAMIKYRRLLSQTSTRDDKLQVSDHKPRLFVAGEHYFGSSERNTHKRIRSLPNINHSDFMHNPDFPLKPTMDIHISITSSIFDDQQSLDQFVFGERVNVSSTTTKGVRKETKLVNKDEIIDANPRVGLNTSIHQEISDHLKEFSVGIESSEKETKLDRKDEAIDENVGVGQNIHNYRENNHQKESRTTSGTTTKEMKLVENDEVIAENLVSCLDNSNQQEKVYHESEPRVVIEVKKDKSFNDILGMFKKVSDERTKQIDQAECGGIVRKEIKDKTLEKHKGKNLEVGKKTLDHQEKDKEQQTSGSMFNKDHGVEKNLDDGYETLDHPEKTMSPLSREVERPMKEDSVVNSSSQINIRNSTLEDVYKENDEYMFSTDTQPSIDGKRPNLKKHVHRNAVYVQVMEDRIIHLDIDSIKDNAEFQFVKEVLERSGFLENQLLGEWYSSYQPIDPLLFEEVETSFLQSNNLEEFDSMKDEEVSHKIINDHHLLLFDLINEALLELHNKTFTYCPHSLTYQSKVRPMPVAGRVLENVWDIVNMYLSWKPELQPSLDDVLSRDLEKGDGWMNLQNDAELVGIELEEMLADDLLDELVFDDLLM